MHYVDALKLFEFTNKPTSDELKHRYKMLMRKWHPDISKESNAQDMVYKIDEAYKVLCNGEQEQTITVSAPAYKMKRYTHESIFRVVEV